MAAYSQGTVLVLKLISVLQNPERSPEPWRQALQQVADSLQAGLGSRDVLFRLDYPRQFGLLIPGLAQAAASAEIGARAASGRAARGPDGNDIQALTYSFSWPEDGKSPEELEKKLHEAFDNSPELTEHTL